MWQTGRVKISELRSPATASGATSVQNSFVLPEQKIVFVSIGKNACSTIKWMLADISGQDISRFHSAVSAEPSRRMTIHHRNLWQNTPRLEALNAKQLADISPANGWFVFAVVRDPRLKLFSAWQSKFLVGDPIYSGRKYADQTWLPRTPESADDVLEDWRRFVELLATTGHGHRMPRGDGHFAPQTVRLHEDVVPFNHIYEISELRDLPNDLSTHLGTLGIKKDLELYRENDTPLAVGREVYENGVREQIEQIYAADLERFGYLWSSFDSKIDRPIAWSQDGLRDIASRRATYERLADLHKQAKSATAARQAAMRQVRELTAEKEALEAKVAKLSGTGKAQPGIRPALRRLTRRG